MASAERFLSSSWYRVATLRPKLRESARVQRHRYRGSAWYVVSDSVNGRVHRLAPAAYAMVAAMDGQRTIDELWSDAAVRLGEDAPSQDQVIQLLGQLHGADLLQGDVPPDAHELFDRQFKQERARFMRFLLNPLSIRIPLIDPDRFLTSSLRFVQPLFGWLGAVLWLAIMLPALVLAAQHWTELSVNVGDRILAADNLIMIALCYPVVKALHELGHGYATKTYGGEVHEMGIMFLVFFPLPYVDASAAAGFRGRWRRMVVGAAGMLVELFVAALALYVWLAVEPGPVRALAFNVIITAGVTTILFNANPLLRYDGYYILADLLEIPNLAVRGTRYWGHLIDRYVFRTEGVRDFASTRGERIWFLIYTPAAFLYRQLVTFSIALFLASHYLAVGVALALWGCVTGLAIPIGRALWNVIASPRLARNRFRAVGLTFAATAAVAALLLWLPAPLHTVTEGVVWLPDSAIVRAGTDGFVKALLVAPGAFVRQGQRLIASEEPELQARVDTLRARVTELEAKLASQRFTDRAEAAVTEVELDQARAELARDDDRAAHLVARAGADGVLTVEKPDDLPGRYVKQGEVMAYALPSSGAQVVRATVPQDDIDLVREHLRHAEVKLVGRASDTYAVHMLREVPSGQDQLPHKALGSLGGGATAVDPRDQHGTRALQRVFQVDLELPTGVPSQTFGDRAYVRFEHDWEPLGAQLYRRLRQLLLSRIQE
jgi:putative peptide zinc metalloprotease protein